MTGGPRRSPALSRRQLLRSAGAAGVLFPFLRPAERAAAAAAGSAPRLILLMQSNGTLQSHFWPQAPGPGLPPTSLSSPILDPLVQSPTIAARTTLLKGLVNQAGGAGNGHDHGFCGLYSGWKSIGSFNDPWGGGISLDQRLRATLTFAEPFPTLNCGVLASDTPPFKAHRRSFSYRAARQQIPTDVDPYRLYARYFASALGRAEGADPVLAARRRLRGGRTVLDFARADIGALMPALGRLDREKLEAHATALREMEQRLAATLTPAPDRPAYCGDVRPPAEGLNVRAEADAPALMRVMFDFVALAVACKLTRIVTFPMGHGGEKWYFGWLGIDENTHDDVAHRDHGVDALVTEKILKMNLWYAQQVAYLCQALERLPDGEGGGTVLDSSLVVWGNEMATGPHAMADIPVVLVGRAAGRLPTTGTMVDAGPQDYHRLGTSLLNLMGVPANGFGEAPDCGSVVGLDLAPATSARSGHAPGRCFSPWR